MIVKAKQGCICPRLDPRMPPIGDGESVIVPDIAYYRRRVADGSLVRVPAIDIGDSWTGPAPVAEPAKKAGKEKA